MDTLVDFVFDFIAGKNLIVVFLVLLFVGGWLLIIGHWLVECMSNNEYFQERKRRALISHAIRTKNLSGIALDDLNLSGQDLRKVTLKKLQVRNVNFSGSDLGEATLTECVFTNCNFKDANLMNANCYGSEFNACSFVSANCDKAKMKGCKINDSDWRKSTFRASDLTGSYFRNTSLLHANFLSTDLTNVTFSKCDLEYCAFNTGTKFSHRFDPFAFKMNPIDEEANAYALKLFGEAKRIADQEKETLSDMQKATLRRKALVELARIRPLVKGEEYTEETISNMMEFVKKSERREQEAAWEADLDFWNQHFAEQDALVEAELMRSDREFQKKLGEIEGKEYRKIRAEEKAKASREQEDRMYYNMLVGRKGQRAKIITSSGSTKRGEIHEVTRHSVKINYDWVSMNDISSVSFD